MPRSVRVLVALGAFVVSCTAVADRALAQEQPPPVESRPVDTEPTSGPAPGTPLPALGVYAPAGIDAGLEFDVAALFGRSPGVVLFVHELTRNVAPVVRALDHLADRHAPLGLEAVTVLLGADRNELERRAPAASQSLGLTRPLTVAVDGAEGPGAWALDRRAVLTVVCCDDGRVVRRERLTDTGERDVAALATWIEALTGPVPDDPGALRAAALAALPDDPATLRARAARSALLLHWRGRIDRERDARQAMREPGRGGMRDADAARGGDATDGEPATPAAARPRVGAPPSDATLQALLRRAIRRTADAAELDAVFTAIDARIGDDATLRGEAVEMFRLMLSLDYGTDDARRRATAFVRAAGGEVPAPRGDGGR